MRQPPTPAHLTRARVNASGSGLALRLGYGVLLALGVLARPTPGQSTPALVPLAVLESKDALAGGLGYVQNLAGTDRQRAILLDVPMNRLAILYPASRKLAMRYLDLGNEYLRMPVALTVADDGRVYILDPAAAAIKVFTLQGFRLKKTKEFPVSQYATEMCALGQRLYVYSPADSTIIRAYDLDGTSKGSFGTPFEGGPPLWRRTVSKAALSCLPRSRAIVVASRIRGTVRAYNESGALLWSRVPQGLRLLQLTGNGVRTVTLRLPPTGAHQLLGIVELSPNVVNLQYGFQATPHPEREKFDRIETRSIAVATGRELPRRPGLPPRLFSAGRGDAFYSIDLLPSRRITLWRAPSAGR
jgi:hypothetical protein